MPFKIKIAEMIAYRAAYICSNPECNTLTIGPALSEIRLKNKKGEAAHILGEKPGAARFTSNPSIDVDSVENGLWLCANCHTLIDKNNGSDYTESQLFEWKKEHEETISVLLRTHKSPLPLISRQSTNRKIAQNIVDCLSSKGAYFEHSSIENPVFVISSIDQARKRIQREIRDIDSDKRLKKICKEIQDANREFMNELSLDSNMLDAHLVILRKKVGRQLKQLRDDIGCDISGQITIIIP
ncbi:HNH endonuclease signature motif containing protein [Pectobacterium brasiliense]|uniref:HNH endonuclease signature motif containing protein n=1 Tax=Pectobacterium brasiliense TaxID=180957 RepID=UPI001AF8DDBB|nr:HNH endonuclease signature motif containing protein [Pectobacterium brasiliense]MBN3124048.1 HNH endonuclease [Pectobacterium brasiliense]QSD23991.1 HNH endonuclease [Pectobacterium brasiliense]